MGRLWLATLLLLGCSASTALSIDAASDVAPEASVDVPRPERTQIAAKHDTTCVVRTDGSTWCCGAIPPGMLGTDERVVTEMVRMDVPPALEVAMAGSTVCLRMADRRVRCFDPNRDGPARFGQLTDVASLTATSGRGASVGVLCARTDTGDVWCFGFDWENLLGEGEFHEVVEPRRVARGAIDFALDPEHACFIDAGRRVRCWGSNAYGSIGLPVDQRNSDTPVLVEGVVDAERVWVGTESSYAITRANEGFRWGGGAFSVNPAELHVARRFPVIDGASEVDSSDVETCAIGGNGTLTCWFADSLVNYGAPRSNQSPPDVPMAASASLNPELWFAVDDHEARGGGRCDCGNCGVDAVHARIDARVVPGLSEVTDVAIDGDLTCALRADGTVACWGYWNYRGSLPVWQAEPLTVDGIADARALAVGFWGLCVVRATGHVACGGTAGLHEVAGVSDAVEIATDFGTVCARHVGGDVSCWGGRSAFGIDLPGRDCFGVGRCEEVVRIPGLSGVRQLLMDPDGQCARMNDGGVRCWGPNTGGLLGNGTLSPAMGTSEVAGVRGALDLAMAWGSACARMPDRSLRCWGNNEGNLLARYDTPLCGSWRCASAPVLAGVEPVAQLSGGAHYCAVHPDGGVSCWGGGTLWRAVPGSRSVNNHPGAPARIEGVTNARKVAAGDHHDCALRTDGTVMCWGVDDETARGPAAPTLTRDGWHVLRW